MPPLALCSGAAESRVSAIPPSVTWAHVSGLKPLVEPCLKQALQLLPRTDVWSALGPVPSACLLFLGAYYQAWSQQVSAACLPAFLWMLRTPSCSISIGPFSTSPSKYGCTEWSPHMPDSYSSTEYYPHLFTPTHCSLLSFPRRTFFFSPFFFNIYLCIIYEYTIAVCLQTPEEGIRSHYG